MINNENNIYKKQNVHMIFFFQRRIFFFACLLFLIKLITWKITYSLSVFSDAMESLTNVISGFIGLCSIYISFLPKDKNHPYGHGKIECISTAIEGLLISAIGISTCINTVIKINQNVTFKSFYISKYSVFLMLFTVIINYILGFFACKIGENNRSLTLIASGKHLKIDTYSTLGIIIGLILINKTQYIWIDNTISIVCSIIIIYTGLQLIKRAIAGIMDEYDKEFLKKLSFYLNEKRRIFWIDIHYLKAIKFGSSLHIDFHLTVPWYFNIKEANKEIQYITVLIKNRFGDKIELSVHVDACSKNQCKFCINTLCKVRTSSFNKKILWTLDRTLYL